MRKPPCKDKEGNDCPDRHPSCQATCEVMAEFKAERELINKKRREENDYLVATGKVTFYKSKKRKFEK